MRKHWPQWLQPQEGCTDMATCKTNGVCQNPLGACASKCASKPGTQLRELPLHDADGLSLQARMVWLHIRDEGGWWSAKELARDLLPGDAHAASTLAPCLRALTERGLVVRRKPNGWQLVPVYGVTAACAAPVGYTLEPTT